MSEQVNIERLRANMILLNTMKQYMYLTDEEYETTKKVRIYALPSWLVHMIRVDIPLMLDEIERFRERSGDE